jgi:hypothetical protein
LRRSDHTVDLVIWGEFEDVVTWPRGKPFYEDVASLTVFEQTYTPFTVAVIKDSSCMPL